MKVVYTPTAKESLKLLLDILFEKWGDKLVKTFLEKADEVIALISKQPLMFKATEIDVSVRIATITKQTSLFYEVNGDTIILLFFYDNRQDPIF